jgi:DNA-binding transcriptional regulator GbsR (MarR family)
MSKSRHPELREILLQHEEGLTASEIAKYANMQSDNVTQSVKSMADVYIDRWTKPKKGVKYVPVYIAIKIPENCPAPYAAT